MAFLSRMRSVMSITKKQSLAYAHLHECNQCSRSCRVNRDEKPGVCVIGADTVKHFREDYRAVFPGHNGSGGVFFSGCNLRCTFCQNHERNGFDLTPDGLAECYMKLQPTGKRHNIHRVTPEQRRPQVVVLILRAHEIGLRIPIIYNTSSFHSLESKRLLDGLIDIYLPDCKVWDEKTSTRLPQANNYTATAMESIKGMRAQVGDLWFTKEVMEKKVVVREMVKWLAVNVSKDILVHIVDQYYPRTHVGKECRRNRVTELGALGVKASDTAKKEIRYADVNRPVSEGEVSSARTGPWRFVDEARNGGFNI
ncbi:hypothetical protein BDU57DRAFT_554764 [Ampelomyces quisqualis]|uniref:Radical SAM core domain-containing protein n=1 Tax=Ampelomyces quisqualis TaxID=50730 RepID=A0A6A5QVL1_AMPQU|nr:hypothetical protein BDU57DRAFT_554764 [Ampelomyces quisqualis]